MQSCPRRIGFANMMEWMNTKLRLFVHISIRVVDDLLYSAFDARVISAGTHLVALEGEDREKLGLHASYNWKSPQIHKKDTSTPPQPPLLNITEGWKYREVVKTLFWGEGYGCVKSSYYCYKDESFR